ncbi:MAG: DNA-3-methyladenine glycosylase 2 family protein [Clostridiales bacterium]|nr:DNA-3-methyladenine glycosylase 2 family protein [Clostridiales bacterium]
MHYFQNDNEIEITGVAEFDLARTFECGQCFRWNADEDGGYTGVAMGRAARIRKDSGSFYITGTPDDFEKIWRGYFDLDRDYQSIRRSLCVDDYMTSCTEHGVGIRILRQDKWEALCSFILSQNNNIPRIKKIIGTLCRLFGDPIAFDSRTFYTFPPAEKLASLSDEDLAPLRSGYRAPYILEAARAVTGGSLDLAALSSGTPEDALTALKKLRGIGDKVANCVVLFGLHMLDAFPVDTWVKKVLEAHYPQGLDPKIFSPYAGLAQQYIFHYARNGDKAV